MNKLFTKIVGVALGLTMAIGVGVAVASNSEAVPVHAATTTTYRHVFTAKPSTGSNITLSSVKWTVSATNLGNYNGGNYAGVQVGTKSQPSDFEMTSSSNWGAESGTYNGKTVVTEIRLWLNTGSTGTITTLTASVGGVACTPDETSITKNSSAVSDYTKATKITFMIGSTNKGVVNIHFGNTTNRALYVCCVEIDCEEPAASDTTTALSVSPNSWTGFDSQTINVSNYTVSCTSTKSPGYEFQGIGSGSGDNFVARVADFTSGCPTTDDTRLQWKAKYPTTAGGSTYLYAYVSLTVTADSVNSIAISGSMTKTTYNQGDAWDPSGFTVNAYYSSAPSTPVDVTNSATWTYSPATTASTSTTSVTCTASFGGKSATSTYTVTVSVFSGYMKVSTADGLVAGDRYVLGFEGKTVLMGSYWSDKSVRNVVTDVEFSAGGNGVTESEVSSKGAHIITLIGDGNGGFYIYDIADAKFLKGSSSAADTTNVDLDEATSWTISFTDGEMAILGDTGRYLEYNNSSPRVGSYIDHGTSSYPAPILYRLSGSSLKTSIETFNSTKLHMEDYDSNKGWCADSEHHYYLTAKAAYNDLAAAEQQLFKTSSEYSAARARYEAWATANKDGAPYDGNDDIQTSLSARILPNIISDGSNTVAIIVIISLVSLTAIGGYFFLRKRKEQ